MSPSYDRISLNNRRKKAPGTKFPAPSFLAAKLVDVYGYRSGRNAVCYDFQHAGSGSNRRRDVEPRSDDRRSRGHTHGAESVGPRIDDGAGRGVGDANHGT